MKQATKWLFRKIAPQKYVEWYSARSRAHSHHVVKQWGGDFVNPSLIEKFGNEVLFGPFQGLKLSPMTMRELIGPFLIGTFESELYPAWDEILNGSYNQMIDIGSKFGYYSVGLARRYPNTNVVAFDTDWWARKATREMAELNGVKNLQIESYCNADWFTANLQENSFLLSDCEGFESQLFTEKNYHRFKTTTLIIETHEVVVPGIHLKLKNLFQDTHHVAEITTESPRFQPDVDLTFLEAKYHSLVLHELRGEQAWLYFKPKVNSNH